MGKTVIKGIKSSSGKITNETLSKFEEEARKHKHPVFTGQSTNNKILVADNIGFEFGDLRVETETKHIIVEEESAGSIINLAKYWYCVRKGLDKTKKQLVIFHIFKQTSKDDYLSHLLLWDFLYGQMKKNVGDKVKAAWYTYRDLEDLDPVVAEFEKYL
ncbi:hypothetical protein ACFL0P_00710 [Candidatus Omnitrophota bacterium]